MSLLWADIDLATAFYFILLLAHQPFHLTKAAACSQPGEGQWNVSGWSLTFMFAQKGFDEKAGVIYLCFLQS